MKHFTLFLFGVAAFGQGLTPSQDYQHLGNFDLSRARMTKVARVSPVAPSGACLIPFEEVYAFSTGAKYICQPSSYAAQEGTWQTVSGGGGGGGGYATVQSNGTPLAQRTTMNFLPGTGFAWTIADTGSTTTVTPVPDTTILATRATVQGGGDVLCTGGGSATVATCTLAPTPASLTTGMVIQFIPTATSTGAMTLDVDGAGALAAAAVQRQGGGAIQAGDLTGGQQYPLRWSGTAWQMTSAVGGSSTVWAHFTSVSWDGNSYRVLGNVATLPATPGAVISAGAPGSYGANMTTGGSRTIAFQTITPNAISTITVRPLAALAINSFGTGTFVLQVRAACVPLGANPESASFSTYTTTTSTTSTAGAYATTTHTITPGGTCSAGAQVIVQFRRDTTVNASDTAVDPVVFVGASVGM